MSTHSVDVIRIKKIEKHPNADKLEIVVIDGFTCCVGIGQFKVGDLAIYIEPDYIVPDKLEYAFLKGSFRIKSRRFRGEWSQGLLLPAQPGMKEGDNVMELLGITRYNPPEPGAGKGGSFLPGLAETPPKSLQNLSAYDLENWRKYNHLLVEGERVYISEKLHGSSARMSFQQGRLWVGSSNQWKKSPKLYGVDIWVEKLRTSLVKLFPRIQKHWHSKAGKSNAWWTAVENNPWIEAWCRSNPDYVLFGEIFGSVQDLKYGSKQGEIFFRAFDAWNLKTCKFMDSKYFNEVLPSDHRVPLLYVGPYNSDHVKKLALMTKSTLANHIGEGIVVKPVLERFDPKCGRVALKLVSDLYLERH
jgi:RNA ligase (TIGR02306 family)